MNYLIRKEAPQSLQAPLLPKGGNFTFALKQEGSQFSPFGKGGSRGIFILGGVSRSLAWALVRKANIYLLFVWILMLIMLAPSLSEAVGEGVWTQKADFGGGGKDNAVGFSIGNKGYIGAGGTKDFWEYDPSVNTWTKKAEFGGIARNSAVGFSIGNKGYIGTGHDGTNCLKDFWEYDPVNDTWTQRADYTGSGCFYGVGFSIGTKGYIGTGYDNTASTTFTKDFWEYDPSANTWTRKADLGGVPRYVPAGFSTGNKGQLVDSGELLCHDSLDTERR